MPANPATLLDKELAVIRSETAPTIKQAASLKITDAQSYALADVFLGRLVTARKQIKARLSRFLDPLKEAVDKAQEAFREAQDFQEEVDAPLAQAENTVRAEMRGYQIEQARIKREQEEAAQAEARRLEEAAAKKRLEESKARTQQMRERLAAQRAALETEAAAAAAVPVAAPVKAAGSNTRTTRTPQVVDLAAFLKGWGKAETKDIALSDIIEVNSAHLKAVYKVYPEMVASWPGVKIVEDIQIVHRGRSG